MKKTPFIGLTVAATMVATQVLAAGEACLQHNRLQSWKAVDESTMIMTDLQMNQYTVHLNNRCVNLTRPAARLVYRTWENLACLRPGEIITVTAPGLGAVTCSVAGVEAGPPTTAPG